MEIRVKPDLRPCVILYSGARVLFHGYSHGDAVVEHEGGYVSLVTPRCHKVLLQRGEIRRVRVGW